MPADLLLEIGTEELPPTLLAPLAKAFAKILGEGLIKAMLPYQSSQYFASPRRLAVLFENVPEMQPDQTIHRKGPLVSMSLEKDVPTAALRGFAKSCHTTIESLKVMPSDKGDIYVYRSKQAGKTLADLLPTLLTETVEALPIAKRMHWGTTKTSFIRPVHWLVALYGDTILPLQLFGLKAARYSYGHRVHHPHPLTLQTASDYVTALEKAYVFASIEARTTELQKQVHRLAQTQDATAVLPIHLLEELVGLVEWPEAQLIHFDRRFLDLPAHVLITVMQKHQRYIALEEDGRLLPVCIAITNQTFRDPRKVIAGNERVLHARFEDAAFFFEQDRRLSLKERLPSLEALVFQKKLGSMADKSQRLCVLATAIAPFFQVPPAQATEAALLAKTDLVTQMVIEFPELQGIMGAEYSARERHAIDPHQDPLSIALYEQYLPKHADDALPQSPLGLCLALADRLDTVVGIFGIGLAPTGTKDPFALRRSIIAIIRILEHTTLDLSELLERAYQGYPEGLLYPETTTTVLNFTYERLYAFFHEKGIPRSIIEAVLSLQPTRLKPLAKRFEALLNFKEQKEALILAAANKRIAHILKTHTPLEGPLFEKYLQHPAEKALYQALCALEKKTSSLLKKEDYLRILKETAQLQEPLETFFKEVLVMVDEPLLRENRLRLLQRLRQQCLLVADLSCLS